MGAEVVSMVTFSQFARFGFWCEYLLPNLNISMAKNHYCVPMKVSKYKGSKFLLQVISQANSHGESYSASLSQDFLHFICPSNTMYSFLAYLGLCTSGSFCSFFLNIF